MKHNSILDLPSLLFAIAGIIACVGLCAFSLLLGFNETLACRVGLATALPSLFLGTWGLRLHLREVKKFTDCKLQNAPNGGMGK